LPTVIPRSKKELWRDAPKEESEDIP